MHMPAPTKPQTQLLGTISPALFCPDLVTRLTLALDDELGIRDVAFVEDEVEHLWVVRTSQLLASPDRLRAFDFCRGFLAGYVVELTKEPAADMDAIAKDYVAARNVIVRLFADVVPSIDDHQRIAEILLIRLALAGLVIQGE